MTTNETNPLMTAARLHAQTVREIADEHPEADEAERRIRVAIREGMTMTSAEEEVMYEKLREALKGCGTNELARERVAPIDEDEDISEKYTLMLNPEGAALISDLCFAIPAIADSLDQIELSRSVVGGLASALKVIGVQLVTALGSVDPGDADKIRRALGRAVPVEHNTEL